MTLRDLFTALLFLFSVWVSAAWSGETILNTASVGYTVQSREKNSTSNEVNLTVEKTSAQIRFLHVLKSGDFNLTLGHSSYLDSEDVWQPMAAPALPDSTVINTADPVPLNDTALFDLNDLLVIEVQDADRNVDAAVRNTIEITVTSRSGDKESIRLVETSRNSGIFTGYLNTITATSQKSDGTLCVRAGEKIEASYEDRGDTLKIDTAIVTPFSHVFSAEDGVALENMKISLVEVTTGSVIAETLSKKITSLSKEEGESKTAGKSSIVFRFGSAPAGEYRIEVSTPKERYYFPSVYRVNELKRYDYKVKEGVSYGKTFIHGGGPIPALDIPIDKERAVIWIEKRVDKKSAATGEILQYTLTVHNDGSAVARDLVVDDHLPPGLKYKEGTSTLKKHKTTPRLSADGKHLYYTLDEVAAKSSSDITFIAEIGAGVLHGKVTNEAWVNGDLIPKSNRAEATTLVEEELMRSKGIIVGQVYECAYEKKRKGHGVEGVKLYLENGTYVITDKNGKYHLEGIETGTHVLQVDVDMLPKGYAMGKNPKSARAAGRSFSQFVDLGRGALKRVDFCLKKYSRLNLDSNITVKEARRTDNYSYYIPTSVAKMPKYNQGHLKSMQGKTEILWPPKGHVPSIPSTKIAVVHNKYQQAEVWLNDQKVSMLNYDGKVTDANSTTVISTYKGVDLLDGTNTISVKILDTQKRVAKSLLRRLHVSSAPVQAVYVAKHSYAVADGQHSPILAVHFLDENGQPLRSGMTGTFSIDSPYASQTTSDGMKENSLSTAGERNRYTVHSNGTAYIKLQPTTQTGEVTLHFMLQGRDKVVKAWLKPKLRKWIMVGFAEGTVGYNTLSGHTESLKHKGAKAEVVTEGRISFFAKGRIKGEWLLTMAYDSGKEEGKSQLFDEIDPDKYYTLYNDGSQQGYEASSRKKLFLKLERAQFSALFGDFSTELTTTELSAYSRKMTGIKGEYHGEYVQAKLFASHTDQLFMRDELRGDGTSGFYRLKSQDIIDNSERVTLEVRDRYHNQKIIKKKTLQRFRDYEIDYNRGTLYFKRPLYSTDEAFNPQFIVAEYEVKGDGGKHYTYGGRGAVKAWSDKIELGISHISEDSGTKESRLTGADVSIKLTQSTHLKAEIAKTQTTEAGEVTKGEAKLAEIEHLSGGLHLRGYYREQENSFGLGQISSDLGASRKLGLDAAKTFDNRLSLKASLSRDTDLRSNTEQDLLEFRAEVKKTLWSLYAGYRFADHTDTEAVQQMLLGASYALLDQRLKLSVAHDQSFGKDEDLLFPTKTTAGLDYALSSSATLFANYEWARGDREEHDLGRIGMQYLPWSGMTLKNTTVSELGNDTTRIYNTLGSLQTYQFNKNWSISAGYERGELLEGNLTEEEDIFNAYHLGVKYHNDLWSALLSGEYRDASAGEKHNVTAAVYRQVNETLALALSAGYNRNEDNMSVEEDAEARFSLAYRPEQTNWIILNKLDYLYHTDSLSTQNAQTEKIINSLHLNYTYKQKTEIALQHGFKYVRSTINAYEHEGITQLGGIDARYDITETWEMGTQGSLLYAQSADNFDYGLGFYTGYNLFDNMWLALGYNWEGFEDQDFSLQTYRIEGPYARFRMKFDQQSLKDIVKSMSW